MDRHPNPSMLWAHRRRITYLCFAMECLIALGAYSREIPEGNIGILTTCSWVFGLVILGYMGTAVAEDIAKIKGAAR